MFGVGVGGSYSIGDTLPKVLRGCDVTPRLRYCS